MKIEELYKIYLQYHSIQIDSRKVKQNDIFFALKGDNFDGNTFALEALRLGATYAVVDNVINPHPNLILVNNVLQSLQNLALYHRQQFNIPFIAITGSNGKTTTKELMYQILKQKYKTTATEGNLNNHIGVPLTILKVKSNTEIAIIEMGANHQNEIESYCQYTLPNYGIITNIGKAHIGFFGGIDNIKKAKGELFTFLIHNNNAKVFVNADDDYLISIAKKIKTKITYGTNLNADIQGKILANEPFLKVQILYNQNKIIIQSNLVGTYNMPNILCAVAVGLNFKVPIQDIIKSIEDYHPNNSRSQYLKINSTQIILDAYNANPDSVELAIKNFVAIKSNNKILCLGEMKELGNESKMEHQKVIDLISTYNCWKAIFLVGKNFESYANHYKHFNKVEDLCIEIQNQKHILEHAYLLIKGSRSTQMEKLLTSLKD